MDALISSLPKNQTNETHSFRVIYHTAYEGNVCTKEQVTAAKAKGWTPYRSYLDGNTVKWAEYEGSDPTGIILPELENSTATIYTLHGQKVTKPVKGGIYIINGKKVVMK